MFTASERRAIIFLCGILLLGAVLRLFSIGAISCRVFQEAPSKININTASLEELKKIPFVGESIARRIVSYRKLKGRIESSQDLENIKGIGKKKRDIISKFITF